MKRMSMYRKVKWVRGINIISSKNKVVDVVGRKVWFADKRTYSLYFLTLFLLYFPF